MNPEIRQDRIDEVFAEAVELPADMRQSFLNSACNGDADIRAEIEKLLVAHDRAEQSTEFLASVSEDIPLFRGSREQGDPLLGEEIGPYQVKRRLGGGGFGDVYLARRTKEYRQTVAIKILRDRVHDLPRFELERQLMADLQHEHIARLLDGGTFDDGRPYIIMEYIDGQPITEYCDANRMTVRKRLALFRQVCDAIAYAHRHSIIHRDIKPGNILVTGQQAPFVKLLDFGIAKMLDVPLHQRLVRSRQSFSPLSPDASQPGETMSDSQTLAEDGEARTRHGSLGPMTPSYASPEQVIGQQIGTTTDVYSLGVVLYELFTGLRPYAFANHSWDEVRRVVCEEVPPRPSEVVLQHSPDRAAAKARDVSPTMLAAHRGTRPLGLSKSLQGDLDAIVLKALRKEPQKRYQTIEALREDLDRFERGYPVAARPVGRSERVVRWCRRNPWLGASIAMGLLLVTMLLVMGPGVAARERYLRSVETQKSAIAEEALRKARSAENEERRRAEMYRNTVTELQKELDSLGDSPDEL